MRRHQRSEPDEGHDADGGDRPERRPPTELLAEECAKWYTEHVGYRQTGEHRRNRTGLLGRLDHRRRDDRADAEERAVAQRREDSTGQQRGVRRGDGRQQVAHDEQDHQAKQHALSVQPRHGGRQPDRADRDGSAHTR